MPSFFQASGAIYYSVSCSPVNGALAPAIMRLDGAAVVLDCLEVILEALEDLYGFLWICMNLY